MENSTSLKFLENSIIYSDVNFNSSSPLMILEPGLELTAPTSIISTP